MTVTNGYCTADELSRRLASDGVAVSATLDDEISEAVTSASRAIDAYCNRRFFADTSATARVYDVSAVHYDLEGRQVLEIHDCQASSITGVAEDAGDTGTYGTTWAANTDYYTYPLNGLNERGETWPITRLVVTGTKTIRTTGYRPVMQVTAKWGWAAVPAQVKQACLTVAADLVKQREAPFGVAGYGEFGAIRVQNDVIRRVMSLLGPYRRDDLLPMVGV